MHPMAEANTPNGNPYEPLVVTTGQGRASFQRRNAATAEIKLEFRRPGVQVDLTRTSLAEGVQRLCEEEVSHQCDAFREMADLLTRDLDDKGKEPVIHHKWRNSEERSWKDQGSTLFVEGAHFETQTVLTGFLGVSDAKLVQEMVRLLLEQREENIRGIYRQMLADVQERRARPQ